MCFGRLGCLKVRGDGFWEVMLFEGEREWVLEG